MYSVEWIYKNHTDYEAWNQRSLHRFKWAARWSRWDFKHSISKDARKILEFRIRKLEDLV